MIKLILLAYSLVASIFIPVSALVNNQDSQTIKFALAFIPVPLFLIGTIVHIYIAGRAKIHEQATSKAPLIIFSLLLVSLLGLSAANIIFSSKKIEDENKHLSDERSGMVLPQGTDLLPGAPKGLPEGVQGESETPKKWVEIIAPDGEKSVNIRRDPTTSSEVVDESSPGDVFEYTEKVSGWYKIILIEGKVGWIKETYAKAVNIL